MSPADSPNELLLRFLDGRASPEDSLRAAQLLRADPAARQFVRGVAEHAVVVADVERAAQGRLEALRPQPFAPGAASRRIVPVNFRSWRWAMAAAASICLIAAGAFQFQARSQSSVAKIARVTGSSQFFGARGKVETALAAGATLHPGDTLETRSCDAWIELELRDGSKATLAGNSTLRVLDDQTGHPQFKLQAGNLWVSPSPQGQSKPIVFRTPTLAMESAGAQFDLQTSATETMARVNKGSARITQNSDGAAAAISEGQQALVSLNRRRPLAVEPQPTPITSWSCDLGRAPQVILGRWLPPQPAERARLGAEPLLWPLPGRDPVMLYAAALSVLSSSDRPVLLQSGSKLVFRGRTDRPHFVRFGFSAQKMRGVFAGKFELDVRPDQMGHPGEPWEITLPLADFRALQPQLSFSPDGLELRDVYALTVKEDAGLELNHIELSPPDPIK